MYSFIIQDFIAFGKWNKKTKKQPANRTKNADTNAFWCSNFSKMLPQSLRRGVSYFCAAKIKTKPLHKKEKEEQGNRKSILRILRKPNEPNMYQKRKNAFITQTPNHAKCGCFICSILGIKMEPTDML